MRRDQRGITILEVTLVLMLTSVVMMGLVGFYLSSQATWIESSSQAITQRDATLALERIGERVRAASSAVTPAPGMLVLYDRSGAEMRRFWLEPSDSLLHHGVGGTVDDGPLVNSRVARFDVSADTALVTVTSLVLAGPHGTSIEARSGAALYNRP